MFNNKLTGDNRWKKLKTIWNVSSIIITVVIDVTVTIAIIAFIIIAPHKLKLPFLRNR